MNKYLLPILLAAVLASCSSKPKELDLKDDSTKLSQLAPSVAIAIELRTPLIILAIGMIVGGGFKFGSRINNYYNKNKE